jgi:hypothetical protein
MLCRVLRKKRICSYFLLFSLHRLRRPRPLHFSQKLGIPRKIVEQIEQKKILNEIKDLRGFFVLFLFFVLICF